MADFLKYRGISHLSKGRLGAPPTQAKILLPERTSSGTAGQNLAPLLPIMGELKPFVYDTGMITFTNVEYVQQFLIPPDYELLIERITYNTSFNYILIDPAPAPALSLPCMQIREGAAGKVPTHITGVAAYGNLEYLHLDNQMNGVIIPNVSIGPGSILQLAFVARLFTPATRTYANVAPTSFGGNVHVEGTFHRV